MDQPIEWLIENASLLLTALGLFLTAFVLRANHDWNRRHYATQLVAGWNEKTGTHRKEIELLKPGLIDLDTRGKPVEISKVDADKVYCCTPHDKLEWELRFHFIELLNYFESIAAAYWNGVADRRIIEESLRNPLNRWHDILLNFMAIVQHHRGYEPWEPFTRLVSHWRHRAAIPRKKTA